MAVKASATVTLSSVVDVKSVWRYYKLQASTLSKPSKPTTNPPSGWTTTEPSYTEGSTNSLYFCDLTVFCDNTFIYSDVSLSSSYEAAKAAYNKAKAADNKAQDAKDTADNTKSEIISMGEQLVINGSGLMGDNTNFSSLTFDASKANGSAGSFTRTGATNTTPLSDNFFPVSPTLRYSFELDAMSAKASSSMYAFLDFYDVDKKEIIASTHMYVKGTLTTLAKDLKNGDTVVYLTSMTNWRTSWPNNDSKGLIFWNYKNSFGYTYPEHTYSRNVYANLYEYSGVNTTAKTITLSSAWTHGTIPAGTKVSQRADGATFKYQAMGDTKPPTEWKHYSGYYDGTDYSGNNVGGKFPPGTAYAKVGFLWNYNRTDDQVWVTNISVKTDYQHAIDEVATRVTNAETSITNNQNEIKLRATKTEVTEVKNIIRAESNNLLDASDFAKTYINASTGGLKDPSAGTSTFDYTGDTSSKSLIPVVPGGTYRLSLKEPGAAPSTEYTGRIATFDSSQNFIGLAFEGILGVSVNDYVFTVPGNAAYIRVGILSFPRCKWSLVQTGDYATNIDLNTTKTELTQTSEEIRMDFTKSIQTVSSEFQDKVDETNTSMSEQFSEINKYIRFVDGKIILGETGNELTLTIQNDRVSFTQSGVEVAYFSNNNLYVKKAEILTTLRIGNHEFTPRADGGLALRKRSV